MVFLTPFYVGHRLQDLMSKNRYYSRGCICRVTLWNVQISALYHIEEVQRRNCPRSRYEVQVYAWSTSTVRFGSKIETQARYSWESARSTRMPCDSCITQFANESRGLLQHSGLTNRLRTYHWHMYRTKFSLPLVSICRNVTLWAYSEFSRQWQRGSSVSVLPELA